MITLSKPRIYFEGDIEMGAKALVELFGDDAPQRARGRAGEYPDSDAGRQSAKFWRAMADAAQKLLDQA